MWDVMYHFVKCPDTVGEVAQPVATPVQDRHGPFPTPAEWGRRGGRCTEQTANSDFANGVRPFDEVVYAHSQVPLANANAGSERVVGKGPSIEAFEERQ